MLFGPWSRADMFSFGDIVMPANEPVPTTTSTDWSAGLVATVGATWLLMQQPTLAQAQPLGEVPSGSGAAIGGKPREPVTIIDLRHTGQAHDSEPSEASARQYHHRWVVRGHWRQQACGPGRTQRRPVFIAPHVKGPSGAPLLDTEQVNVWRR